jgi:hypothetical protein
MGGMISKDAAAEIKGGMIGLGQGLGQGLGLAQLSSDFKQAVCALSSDFKQAVYALCFTVLFAILAVMIVALAYIWRPQSG